jgi:SAM-dependent methyltransferase
MFEESRMTEAPPDAWLAGDRYEPYIGRWSRLVAQQFIEWLHAAPALTWLDVGCGTGALSGAILEIAAPASVTGVDPSDAFVAHARAHVVDSRVGFRTGDAQGLPFDADQFDIAVSGLVLNFVPDPLPHCRKCDASSEPAAGPRSTSGITPAR